MTVSAGNIKGKSGSLAKQQPSSKVPSAQQKQIPSVSIDLTTGAVQHGTLYGFQGFVVAHTQVLQDLTTCCPMQASRSLVPQGSGSNRWLRLDLFNLGTNPRFHPLQCNDLFRCPLTGSPFQERPAAVLCSQTHRRTKTSHFLCLLLSLVGTRSRFL